MHSNCRPRSSQSRVPSEYIRINIKDILYSPELLQASPEHFAEAIGVKILCFVHCWVSGRIPHDLCTMSRLLRVPEKTVARSWPVIGCDFESIGDSHFIHPGLEADRQEMLSISEKRRRSAYASWNASEGPSDSSPFLSAGDAKESPRKHFSRAERGQKRLTDQSGLPLAVELVSAWNSMATETGGVIAPGTVRDLPDGIETIVDEIGGKEQILEAMRRIPKLPFYLGSGPHGWRASLPWLFQKKSIANLLAQTVDTKAPAKSKDDLTDADRALIDQFREGDSPGTEA
jgi:hypothetical protein